MPISPINFDFGVNRIDQLVDQMREPGGSCHQRMQCALKGLAEVQAIFERGRQDLVTVSRIRFKVVTHCCTQLKNLSTLVFKPSSPFGSPSKPRVNGEVAINEGELCSTITMTQRTVVGNWFAALNRTMESVRTHLKFIAEKTSTRNINLVKRYRASNRSSDDCLRLSMKITKNLDKLSPILKALARVSDDILASLDSENMDRALVDKEDLQTFYRILHGSESLDGYEGIYDIYSKISNSLALAKEDNDRPIMELFYTPSFDPKDLKCIEEDKEGRPRDPFDVLKDYEEMIRGFLNDMNSLLQKDHESPTKVLLVYSQLKEYMDARNEYLGKEAEIYRGRKEALNDKILKRSLEIMRLRRMGATQREIDAASNLLKRTEEKLVACKEDFKEITKMGETELYEKAQEALEYVRGHDQYKAYLTYSTFESVIKFDTGHWLLDPLVCQTIVELRQVEEAFRHCDSTVQSLTLLLKRGSSLKTALISPLNAVAKLISGPDYIHKSAEETPSDTPVWQGDSNKQPYAQLTLSMTDYQRQIYAAASMENREEGLAILNDLWKTAAVEVDAKSGLDYIHKSAEETASDMPVWQADINTQPYTQLTLSITEYQRQIYAAASTEDSEEGLAILNHLSQMAAVEVDAKNEMSYNEV